MDGFFKSDKQINMKSNFFSEDKVMDSGFIGKSESGSQILFQQIDFFDVGKESSINFFLLSKSNSFSLFFNFLLFSSQLGWFSKDGFSSFSDFFSNRSSKESIVNLFSFNSSDVNFSRSRLNQRLI